MENGNYPPNASGERICPHNEVKRQMVSRVSAKETGRTVGDTYWECAWCDTKFAPISTDLASRPELPIPSEVSQSRS